MRAALIAATMLSCVVASPSLAQTPAKDLPVFRIGVLNDQSGLYADTAGIGSVIATQMAVDDFEPEKHGFRVEVISADHQNKPDIGSSIARRWYDLEKVDAIVDVPTSSVALAIADISRDRNKAFLVASAGTSDLTAKACTPNTVHWTYDTWALANGTARAMIKRGGDSWYFLTADYAFGHALERDAAEVVKANGGKVLGRTLAPFQTSDFSSFILQAQGSGAKVVALANSGGDTINSVKQAAEFGLPQKQSLVSLLTFISDIHSLGLKTAQGLMLTNAFYWDRTDGTRAFAKALGEKTSGRMPTMTQAGSYAATLHWMKAIAAMDKAKAHDGAAVVAKMKEIPTDDPLFGKGYIRPDGRTIHDMYLWQVKAPEESKGPYDYLKLVAVIPGDEAFRPMSPEACPMLKKKAG